MDNGGSMLKHEAIASISLDGDTHCCMACLGEHVTVRMDGKRLDEIVGYGEFHLEDLGDGVWHPNLGGRSLTLSNGKAVSQDGEFHAGSIAKPGREHVCGKRGMTAAERELVEAALLFVTRHTGGRGCEIRLDLSDCGSSEEIVRKAEAVRAERKEAAK